ncbi:hypothetical protein G9A89_016368 [Geosiphon pyriformis]|nr:hypothetical protein G9A89_016368 [Geosiphon pyriformis]
MVSTKIITANKVTKTLIDKIDNFPFEVNDIIISIKVLVIEATQYQILVSNNWLSKTNTMLDWTTQKLQFSQSNKYIQVSATCGHFKPSTNTTAPLIAFKNEEKKPT